MSQSPFDEETNTGRAEDAADPVGIEPGPGTEVETVLTEDPQPGTAGEPEPAQVIDHQPGTAVEPGPAQAVDNQLDSTGVSETDDDEEPVRMVDYQPESSDETARQGGLAMSAGIVFFSSVAFTLFLGWIADLLLGSSPWGLVGGIVLGSIIGFLQFFRITSQIFTSKRTGPAERPLMPHDDEDE